MTLGEKIKTLRKKSGLTQEKLAKKLNVSRQAVTKWEADQARPTTDNLILLSNLFDVSIDEFIEPSNKAQNNPTNNLILRANLTKLAIIFQTAFLNATIQDSEFTGSMLWVCFTILPLFASSIWMAYNLNYEKDLVQKKKNAQIELFYCMIQLVIAFFGYTTKHYFITEILFIVICSIYIIVINPKYMNRQLVKNKNSKR